MLKVGLLPVGGGLAGQVDGMGDSMLQAEEGVTLCNKFSVFVVTFVVNKGSKTQWFGSSGFLRQTLSLAWRRNVAYASMPRVFVEEVVESWCLAGLK